MRGGLAVVVGLWAVVAAGDARALRMPALLDTAASACPSTPLSAPDELRRAALRLARAGYARNAAVVLDDVAGCDLLAAGAPLALEAAFVDELLEGLRLLPPPPTLAVGREQVPASPRLAPSPRRRRMALPLVARAGQVDHRPAAVDPVALARRGFVREGALLAGIGALHVAPTPNALGVRVEASYADRRVPVSLSARWVQSVPMLTPTVVAIGEVGVGLRFLGRRASVQLDWGRTWLNSDGVGRGNDLAVAKLVIPF
jgi:hypothetical protein